MGRVLLVAKVRPGGHRYYLDYVEAVDADGRSVEEPGRWAGRGAARLGLTADTAVDDRRLGAVMAGRHPDDAGGVALGGRRQQATVAAFDLSFCAPKSVSVMHGVADDDVARLVRAGHEAAVDAARSYLERHGASVRRRPREPEILLEVSATERRIPVEADVVAASFTHRTSRALDPHLHTHVVVANLACDAAGGWSALDGRGVYAHRAAADALYHAHLRHELTDRLGVSWSAPNRGRADIDGVGPEVRRAFSQRAAEIAADLEASGRGSSRKATTIASHRTRLDRRLDTDRAALQVQWRARARDAGLSPRRLDAVLGRAAPGPLVGADGDGEYRTFNQPELDRLAGAVWGARQNAGDTFTRRQVVAAMAASASRGMPAPSVEAAADRFIAAFADSEIGVERPGVAERRRAWPERQLERTRTRGHGLELAIGFG